MSGLKFISAPNTEDPAATAGSTSLWCLAGQHRKCRELTACVCNICQHRKASGGPWRTKGTGRVARKPGPKKGNGMRLRPDGKRDWKNSSGCMTLAAAEREGITTMLARGATWDELKAAGYRHRAIAQVKKELRGG